jgi:hypothetical protein
MGEDHREPGWLIPFVMLPDPAEWPTGSTMSEGIAPFLPLVNQGKGTDWAPRQRFPRQLAWQEFCQYWGMIQEAYLPCRHAFLAGCGRETLARWICETVGFLEPRDMYACLFQAKAYGLIRQGQSYAGYRTWTMTPPQGAAA